jgi:hypothetical protein
LKGGHGVTARSSSIVRLARFAGEVVGADNEDSVSMKSELHAPLGLAAVPGKTPRHRNNSVDAKPDLYGRAMSRAVHDVLA